VTPNVVIVLTVVAVLAVLTIVMVLARRGQNSRRGKPRIVIHPAAKVIMHGNAKRNCPACQEPLDGLPVAKCRLGNHVIHAMCKDLVKGRCPQCNGPIA
jgi:hypothetical protein